MEEGVDGGVDVKVRELEGPLESDLEGGEGREQGGFV